VPRRHTGDAPHASIIAFSFSTSGRRLSRSLRSNRPASALRLDTSGASSARTNPRTATSERYTSVQLQFVHQHSPAGQIGAGARNPPVRSSSSATTTLPRCHAGACRTTALASVSASLQVHTRIHAYGQRANERLRAVQHTNSSRAHQPAAPRSAIPAPPRSNNCSPAATGSIKGHAAPVPGCGPPRAPQTELPGSRMPPAPAAPARSRSKEIANTSPSSRRVRMDQPQRLSVVVSGYSFASSAQSHSGFPSPTGVTPGFSRQSPSQLWLSAMQEIRPPSPWHPVVRQQTARCRGTAPAPRQLP